MVVCSCFVLLARITQYTLLKKPNENNDLKNSVDNLLIVLSTENNSNNNSTYGEHNENIKTNKRQNRN